MNSGLDSLHKILKDETRRRIVLLLKERESLSYTDLMSHLKIVNTGTLNYHLKALDDLIVKGEKGQYLLSERGRLASKLLIEFSEQDGVLQAKKKDWRRLWLVIVALNSAGLLLLLSLTSLGYLDLGGLARGIMGFISSTVCFYFFFRMVRPLNKKQVQRGQARTIQDVFVSGRHLQEVHEEVQRWINEEGIVIEAAREGFVRGRLGVASVLGWSTPKYFEVSYKPDQDGVMVHTEGWISLFDVSERNFSKTALAFGGVPRKKGWKVIEHLWKKLKALSK